MEHRSSEAGRAWLGIAGASFMCAWWLNESGSAQMTPSSRPVTGTPLASVSLQYFEGSPAFVPVIAGPASAPRDGSPGVLESTWLADCVHLARGCS